MWGAGLLAALVVGGIVASARAPRHALDAIDVAVLVAAQAAAMLGGVVWVSRRKGNGSLRRDFGLVVHPGDWRWLVAGVAVQVGGLAAVAPVQLLLHRRQDAQQTVRALQRSGAAEAAVALALVVVLVPLVEELVFRGLLLRGLLRRTGTGWTVAIDAGVFGVAHLVDPGAAIVLVPLLVLGGLSAARAVRTGELSQSVLLHAGFNLLAAVSIVAG